jgi:signal transduction histidine kinase
MDKENNVLFLDDEVDILSAVDRLLISEPYGILKTSDPDEALEMIGKYPVKVVVSDQRMPKMSGVEFLRKVKERYPDRMRMLLSGYVDFTTAEEAINFGEVYRFITKPWKTTYLKASILQAIEQYDLVETNRTLLATSLRKTEEVDALNKKLQAMYEAQKAFTSTVSHELRTPLASIKMAIDMVIGGTAGALNDQQTRFLGKAKDNVDRLNRLINDILDLTKLESGRMPLKLEKANIHDVIQETVEIQGGVAGGKGLYLKAELAGDVPPFPFDKDRMIQVLSNLVSNALKFTDKGGITVATSFLADKGQVRISVRDTGPGIRQEDIPKLFQKFQQLGDAGERKTGGTGLGLAISAEIVHRHGGEIWVESTYGAGSSFNITLNVQGKMEEGK